ncbi:phosphoinositide binding [Raphanus sativus]|uniref:Uncharacterized protein LOC130496728 n=1 Tax=Raphanus sativus TaxID=3726 RepID=A0A9W3C0P9_RAPSA|nr:uncharacterized protein LOC130496728 [Raphanus sativus]KAJ4887296.1 phosphoinositide binding [Raphanus sativus]
MLEKIGLPAKPSLRGNSWVVDASHCQGCSSQFTFINRKHHCRRCGGLFCGSCTQQRMSLRGQGDTPVRICDPCKTLEEAARFELRHGYKNRAAAKGGGSSKRTVKNEDDVLSEILGSDADVSSSSESVTSKDMGSSSSNKAMELDAAATPEELRKQAVEEKNKYRVLKQQGKSEEALKAFKRGKELERQADALEISLRKDRKRALSLRDVAETQNKAATKESSRSQKQPPRKDDLAAELRDLGWSDDEDKKPATVSLEGEFSSLLREIPGRKTNQQKSGGGIDKSQVIAIKKKALALKREGKLAEAKEELKRAKVLEREIEEQELLGGADESDDELSALINSMDDDKEDDLLAHYEGSHDFDDIGNLVGSVDDIGVDGEFDVTDQDMEDPAIAAALKSLGWTEDPGHRENVHTQSSPNNREERLAEIQTLKREALTLKRAGNAAEALATLKKAKLLERELESADTSPQTRAEKDTSMKHPPRSRLAIQRELLAVKKKALTLKREGKVNEAEEELKKGEVLQEQLEELDNTSKLAAAAGKAIRERRDLGNDMPDISVSSLDDDGEVDVKDEELNDPGYLSMLKSLGWNDEDNNHAGDSSGRVEAVSSKPRRSKGEIQRELLGLKRKALTLRRHGNVDEAEEVQKQTKILEAQLVEIESGNNLTTDGNQLKKTTTDSGMNVEEDDSVTENDMKDPALLSTLKNLGWEDEEPKRQEAASSSLQSTGPRVAAKSKGQIQRELLDLKRKALALKRQGKNGEADGVYSKAKVLEAQLAEMETPKDEPMGDAFEKKVSAPTINPTNYMDVDLLGDFISPAKSDGMSESRVVSQSGQQQPSMMDLLTGEKSQTPGSFESVSVQNTSPQNTLKQDILAHKRKALALKKEGKISEAKEALQQAKLLERRLEEGENPSPEKLGREALVSATQPPVVREKENSPKPMSSRDRFKLQQESLSHKRQAMKLRREGKMEEAEAEFEIAKTLEAQLEDSTSSKAEPVEDVAVEDFLDPQLLSALKAIGLDSSVNTSASKPDTAQAAVKPVKPSPAKESDGNQERSQLEERIKAEKIKAVTLKRSGKQAEALDALRRAKLYEKKLNALA